MTLNLDSIRSRLAAATPGPWKISEIEARMGVLKIMSNKRPIATAAYYMGSEDVEVEHNADFISHAPEDIRLLLERVETLRIALRDLLEVTQRQARTGGVPYDMLKVNFEQAENALAEMEATDERR